MIHTLKFPNIVYKSSLNVNNVFFNILSSVRFLTKSIKNFRTSGVLWNGIICEYKKYRENIDNHFLKLETLQFCYYKSNQNRFVDRPSSEFLNGWWFWVPEVMLGENIPKFDDFFVVFHKTCWLHTYLNPSWHCSHQWRNLPTFIGAF